MVMCAKGLAKLIEECGELVQVAGKKLACYKTDGHWDGTDLKERMEDEMGDVQAAIIFVVEKLNLNLNRINSRTFKKLCTFREWDNQSDNNSNGVDG